MKTTIDVFNDIQTELDRSFELHGDLPANIVGMTAIMAEEAGECVKAANNCVFHGATVAELEKEAIQTAAMCVKMVMKINKMKVAGVKK